MSDEEVIKRRLIFDGDGTGEDRRINGFMKILAKWVHTKNESPEECQKMYNKLLGQISSMEQSRIKSDLASKSSMEELDKYHLLYSKYETKICKLRQEIKQKRSQLEKARIVRQNRIQYDALATDIAAEPLRKEMKEKLELLEKELKEINEVHKLLDMKLDKKRKQFHVISTSANQLSMYLDNEKTKEESTEDSKNNTSLDDITANSPEAMSE